MYFSKLLSENKVMSSIDTGLQISQNVQHFQETEKYHKPNIPSSYTVHCIPQNVSSYTFIISKKVILSFLYGIKSLLIHFFKICITLTYSSLRFNLSHSTNKHGELTVVPLRRCWEALFFADIKGNILKQKKRQLNYI